MNLTHKITSMRSPGALKTLVAASTLVFASLGAQAACEYSVSNQWQGGFTATITITNDTNSSVNSWGVDWEYAGDNRITNSWNATTSGSNPYSASNLAWNGNLGVGSSVSFGFQGSGGNAEIPTLTGALCEAVDIPASSSSSSESTTSSTITVSSSSTITVSSSSTDTSGCNEFCDWYGEIRPLCQNQDSGWGWENGACIGANTCENQYGDGSIVRSCYVISSSESTSESSSSEPESSSSAAAESSSSIDTIISSSSESSSSAAVISSSSSVIISSSSSSSSIVSSSSSSISGGDKDWLHVEGNTIVDEQGRAVWLTGANWFGFNATERVFHGLWSAHHETLMKDIADHGINLIRVPISTELIYEWINGVFKPVNVNTYANPELEGLTSLDIFDRTLELADKYGLKIMLDVHSAKADNSGHVAPLWYDATFTEDTFFDTWEWIAARYKDNDTLIAYDLENEPHGTAHSSADAARWDNSNHPNNWKRVAQETARRVLAVNPNVLILIEGVEVYPIDGVNWDSKDEHDYHFSWWGGNLRGVADYPVTVAGHQDQIMYSPHDYGPSVFEQDWFYDGFNRETMLSDVWYDNWFYIHDQEIAPLLIGEWGGHMDGGRNQHWMEELRDFMVDHKIHHTFWCLNPNSGDTGGLLQYDFMTWDEEKYSMYEQSLWKSGSRYVGLDQETPLGSNGMSVNQYYQNGGIAPRGQ